MSSCITKSSLATDGLFNFNSRKKLKRKRRRNKSKNTNLRKKKLKKFYYQKRAGSAKSNSSKLESELNSKLSVMSNWYWSNYKKAVQWQEKHRVAHWKSCALALFEENRYLLQIINQLRPDMYSQTSDPFKKLNARFCSNQNYQFPNQLNKSRNLNDYLNVNDRAGVSNYYPNGDDDDDDDDEENEEEEEEEEEQEDEGNNGNSNDNDDDFEFEMSEEMVEFFKQSYRHKMELKKMKEKELLSKAEDEIQQLQTNKIKRSEEMKLLYGDGASMIIGMETAVQLSFEKYCDIKSPKFWPNIPFRL